MRLISTHKYAKINISSLNCNIPKKTSSFKLKPTAMKFFTLLAVTGGLFFTSLQIEKNSMANTKHNKNKCCVNAKKSKCPLACKRAKSVKLNS